MNSLILHHYAPSPVSEKIRIVLGIKDIAWRSVEVPRVPPKPDVMSLTGGYRRTPFMQIGADIFCDSAIMVREIEARYPQPSLFPGSGDGLPYGINRWADELFYLVAKIVIGGAYQQMPEGFIADRSRLLFGSDPDLPKIYADNPHYAAQLRAQFGWIEERLAAKRPFMLGDQPSLSDAALYYLVWFIRGRWTGGPALLAEFPHIEAWEPRVKAIGHGQPTEMSATEALDIARATEPTTPEQEDPRDPQGLRVGQAVRVVPDLDSGEPQVAGTVRYVDRYRIALLRDDPRVGRVCVHFPRVGYRVLT